MAEPVHLPADLLKALASVATVVTPDDVGYAEARRSFNGLLDRRPAALVRPQSAAAVGEVVALAAASGLPVAVRGGGHSVAGHSMADDALVLDLRLLRDVTVDPVHRIARVEGGALWQDVDDAAWEYGLAMPGGTFGDTGVAGLALGGGIGHLSGTCGLTCDNIIAVELVIATGQRIRVDLNTEPELLWGLRGGGGNFGVVVAFEMSLHEIGPLLGGDLMFSGPAVAERLPILLELMENAPPELVLMPFLRGAEGTVHTTVCYRGDLAVGERLLQPIRQGAGIVDKVRPLSYPQMQATNELMEFGLRNYWKGHFVKELPRAILEQAAEDLVAGRLRGGLLLEPLHGKARQEPAGGAAFTGREARYNLSALATWQDPAEDGERIAWARAFAASLEPLSTGGGYLNYSTEEDGAGVRSAYGDDRFVRLQALKTRWDPENRFRFNHNIAPARLT